MGFTSTVIGLAAVLKLQDDMSQPLDSAIKSAQRRFDELSVTAQRVEKIKAFDGLKAELDSLSAALAEAKRKRDFFVSSAETAGAEGVRQFGNDIRAAKQEVLELDRALNSKQAALREMGQSLRDTGIDTDNLGAALTRLDMEMAKEAGMKAFRARVDELGAKTVAVGKQIESIGLKIGAVGLAGQAGLSRAGLDLNTLVTGAVKAEDALYSIAITAGKSGAAARASVAAWSQQVSRVSVDTNKTQAEVIAALNDLIAKGMDPDAALRMLTPIGKAATGAAADIQSLASASNAAYQNMGVEAARALEIMSQSGKSGAFELRDMAGYFDLLTVKSQLLGSVGAGGLASLGAAAQIARKGAGDASTAANNLANFLDKLTAPVTAKAFDKFGVNLAEEVKKGLASGDLIGYMGALVQQMTQGDAAKLSALFSDVQTKNFIAPLIQNLDEYKRIRNEALNATGVVDQDFETAMQSSGAKLQAFQVQSAAAVNQGPALKGILDTLTGLSTWANDHPDLAKWLIFGTAGAVAAGAVLGGIGATIAAVGGLTAAIPSLITGLGTLTAFLAANPIVLTILGVAAAGAAGYAFGNFIGLDEVGKSLGSALYDVVQRLKKGLGDVRGTLAAWRKVGSDLIDGLIQGIKDKATAVVDSIRGLGGAAVREMKDLLGIRSPSRVFREIGDNVGQGMIEGVEATAPAIQAAAEGLADAAIKGASGRDYRGRFLPADAARAATVEWQRAGEDIERSLTDALMRGFEGGKGWAENFRDTLKNLFNSLVLRPIIQPLGVAGASLFTPTLASASGSGPLSAYIPAGLADVAFSPGASGISGAAGNSWSLSSAMSGASTIASALGSGLANYFDTMGMNVGGMAEMAGFSPATSGAIGSAASALGGAMAGFAVGKMISGGYSAIGGQSGNTAVATGTAIGMAFGPVGALIGGAIGGLVNRAFGMGAIESTSGVSLSAGATGVGGYGYTDYHQDGGWFRSDKNWQTISSIDTSGLSASLGQIAGLLETIGGAEAAARLQRYSAAYSGAAGGVDAWIKTVVEGMARTALPQLWDAFRRAGEEAEETLQRLADTIDTIAGLRAGLDADIGILTGTVTAAGAQARAAAASIQSLTGILSETDDIQTRVDLEGQLHQAVISRYEIERQYLDSLSQTLQQVATTLGQVRAGVSASVSEINPLAVPTAAALREAIAGAVSGLGLPSMSPVLAASDRYSQAQSAEMRLAEMQSSNAALVQSAQADISALYQRAAAYGVFLNATPGPLQYSNDAYAYQGDTNTLAGYGQITFPGTGNPFGFRSDSAVNDLVQSLIGASQSLIGNNAAMSQVQALIASLGGSAGAQEALTTAQQQYAIELQAFAGDATTAITKLETLRSETMRYYQAQEQLSTLMAASSDRLRDAARAARLALSGGNAAADGLARQYDQAYTLALSTSGETLAGYADTLTTLLPDLLTTLAGESSSRSEYQRSAALAIAQSEAIAARLDAQAPTGYEAESLSILSAIDQSLTGLESSIQTVDQQIVAAIDASKSATVDVLVQIRDNLSNALGGTLPGHADGLASVPYDNYSARLHAGEAVIDAATISGLRRYGIPVHSGTPSGSSIDTTALIAEVRALRADNADLRAEVRAVVTHTARTARLLDRVMPDGDALAVRVEVAA